MEDYKIERTANLLVQKYGITSLPKAVAAAKYYLEEGDEDAAKRWVSIGFAIKKIQAKDSITRLKIDGA